MKLNRQYSASHPTIQASTEIVHVFIETRGSCLVWSVTGARKWQHGAGPWQLSKGEMKVQPAWAVDSGRKSTFFSPPSTSKMKGRQGHSTLVMATGAAPSQAYICSQSHLADRGSLTQSLRVPEEPADSSSCRPCCYRKSATGATGFLWVWLLCITRGTSAWCVSLSSWRNMNVLKELERGDVKWLLTRKYVPWHGCAWILEMPDSTLRVTWWCEGIG